MKRVDKEIKKRVQSVRLEVPQRIEEKVLGELASMRPLESKMPETRSRHVPVFAVAASLILMVGGFFISKLLFQAPAGSDVKDQAVEIRLIQVNGKPAKTYFFQSKDKNKLIVWTQEMT